MMTIKNKAGDIGQDEDEDKDDFFFMNERILSKSLEITLPESIHRFAKYLELLAQLRDLPDKTTEVNLYLANYGGYLDGGMPLFQAFKDLNVPVHVHVIGDCYSMGAILALCGTTLTFKPGTTLMFHNYSGGHSGKGKELLDATQEGYNNIWKAFAPLLQPFLTKVEIEKLQRDGDVYVHSWDPTLKNRLKRHFK